MIKHDLQYNSCDHLPETFFNRCQLVGSSTVSYYNRQRTLISIWNNVNRDTGSLVGLFPYNAKRALECDIVPVEDRSCPSNI